MMTKEEIAREWSYHSWRDEFDDEAKRILIELDGAEILFAEYERGGYEGDAAVIFRKDGRVFETYGGHCSCFGLEGQWQPEETTIEAILMRKHIHGTQRDARTAIQALRDAGKI